MSLVVVGKKKKTHPSVRVVITRRFVPPPSHNKQQINPIVQSLQTRKDPRKEDLGLEEALPEESRAMYILCRQTTYGRLHRLYHFASFQTLTPSVSLWPPAPRTPHICLRTRLFPVSCGHQAMRTATDATAYRCFVTVPSISATATNHFHRVPSLHLFVDAFTSFIPSPFLKPYHMHAALPS